MNLAQKLAEAAPRCAELVVYCDGDYVRGKDATVSVWDHGLLYGDGVFEGIRVYAGAFFRIHDHIRRLYHGLHSIGISVASVPEETLLEISTEVIRRNNLADAHLRIIVTRGVGVPGLDPRNCLVPTVLAMAYPMASAAACEPISLMTSAVRRTGLGSVEPRIKSLNYLASVIAKYSANHYGADDAVMLDPDGGVAEATAANIFAVSAGTLYTPPTTFALEGITRRTVLELAEEAGIRTDVRPLSCHELYTADEVFLCGSATELVPVASIDGRTIGRGETGQMTERLREDYFRCVHRRNDYRMSAY